MALENYKVEYEDGSAAYFQFDPNDETAGGKAGLEAMKDAAKNDDSPVKSVTKSDPPTVNSPEELAAQAGGAKAGKG